MDYVDWAGVVLDKLIEAHTSSVQARSGGVTNSLLAEAVFGSEITNQPEFLNSDRHIALQQAIQQLAEIGLLVNPPPTPDIRLKGLRPSKLAQDLNGDLTSLWEDICSINLKPDQEQFLRVVNQISVRCEADYALLEHVAQDDMLAKLGWADGVDLLRVVAGEVETIGLVSAWDVPIYPDKGEDLAMFKRPIALQARYRGLVWQTRREFTRESKFIDRLVAEWETTSVEFKRELHLGTADGKTEFIKDVLGLVNTQASGRRWLIIGFDDKTRLYHGPPDMQITQDRIEQILAQYTTPIVGVRYDLVDYRAGRIGRLEVIRDPTKLPYSVAKASGDKKLGDKKRISPGQIFVRHGSQTEEPTPAELQALQTESARANGTN